MAEAPVVTKKDRRWTKRNRLRRKSHSTTDAPIQQSLKPFNASLHTSSRTNIGPDQTAKIQAAAAALRQQQTDAEFSHLRRNRPREHATDAKTNSVFTLQPVIMSEATPAMKWANRYDRDNLRDAYLKGVPPPEKKSAMDTGRALPALPKAETIPAVKPQAKPQAETPPPAPAHTPTPPPVKSMTAPIEPTPISSRQPAAPASITIAPGAAAAPPTNSSRSPPAINKRMSMSPSPAPSAASTPEKSNKKVSRLRAMFGKKAEGTVLSPVGAPASQQLAVPVTEIGRKSSPGVNRSLAEPKAPQASAPPTPEPLVSPEQESSMKETAPAYPAPPVDEHPALAKNAFSSFDQGPLEPAFVPDDSSDASDIGDSVHPAMINDEDVVLDISTSGSPEPIQDRWAQIRKNAAERAKAQAKAQDDSATTTTTTTNTDARGSMDEGETSGEESRFSSFQALHVDDDLLTPEAIESRVARIKARVAQLTAEGASHRA